MGQREWENSVFQPPASLSFAHAVFPRNDFGERFRHPGTNYLMKCLLDNWPDQTLGCPRGYSQETDDRMTNRL